MKVRDFMTPNPATIGPHDLLSEARDKMDLGHFRRLPVVDGAGKLIGILTDRDLREHSGFLPTTRVTATGLDTPLTVQLDTPVDEAAELMLERKIGGLPVVDAAGELAGIITETDVVRALLRRVRETV